MKYFYQILEQQFWMKRYFLIKRNAAGITSIYPTIAERIKIGIWRIVTLQFSISFIHLLIVFYQPEIGVLSFIEYCFKSQRSRTALRNIGKYIPCPRIGIQFCHCTVSPRHIPCTTGFQFCNDSRFRCYVFHLIPE